MTAEGRTGDRRIIEQFAEPWIDLCKSGPNNLPFFRPEWIATHLRSFDPGCSVSIVSARDGGGWLRALLPLTVKTKLFCALPARVLAGPANAHSCRFDLVRAGGEEGERGVAAIWDHLKRRKGWDVVELPLVAEGGSAEQLVQMARADGYRIASFESDRSPYVPLPTVGPAGAIPHSAHFRQNLRRRLRKAKATWDVRLTRTDRPDAAALERFYELEESGWKGKGGTAIVNSPPTRGFYDSIARVASEQGYFSLYLLEFGDKVVAGHFGLEYAGSYGCPKVAYDEAFSTYGPGHLIIEAIIDQLLPRGFHEFDFLGPWMDWKGEWTRVGRTHTFWYIFQKGAYGNLLHAAKTKAEPEARKAVRAWRKYRAERAAAQAAPAKPPAPKEEQE